MADMGIGETILLSAALGGGTSAVQGKDPLQGALLGGAMGGIGAGLGSAFGGAGASAGTGMGAGISEIPTELGGLFQNAQGTLLTELPSELGGAYQSLGGNMYGAAGQAITPTSADIYAQLSAEASKSPFQKGIDTLGQYGTKAIDWAKENPKTAMAIGAAPLALGALKPNVQMPDVEEYNGPLKYFKYDPRYYKPYTPTPPNPVYRAQYAGGGITALSVGGGLNASTGPVERMSQSIVGQGGMYPQSQIEKTYFATPTQMPTSAEVVSADYEPQTNPFTGAMMASGGTTDLGSYSDGGRMLKGPGDGMSDSIPATIGGKQPARLAEGEFVVPADVVSHLGNGSTEAGAKQLYDMMDKVRKARTGTKKQGKQIKAHKYLPA